jgi:hypothetical protein
MPYRELEEERVAAIVRGARVVGVVGMKDEKARNQPAYTVPERMHALGIRVIPINPTITSSQGDAALASVGALTEKVDLIQVFRRPETVEALADEIVAMAPALRPSVVWMQSGIVNEAAAEKLAAVGIEVVMDRCFAVDAAKYRRSSPSTPVAR